MAKAIFAGPLGGVLKNLLGFAVGSLLRALFMPKPRTYGPEGIANLQFQTTARGVPLPFHYGRQKFAGNIVAHWGFRQVKKGGGKGGKGGGGGKQQQEEITYVASFVVNVCEGPVDRIHRMWSNKALVDLSKYGSQIRIRKGLRQAADSTMQTVFGAGSNQPQHKESVVLNGSNQSYIVAHTPVVADSDLIYSFGAGPAGSIGSRTIFARVSASPGQNQYTISNSDGRIVFGGTYSNVTVWIEYKQGTGATTDVEAYPHMVQVVFLDWDLGPTTMVPNFTFEVSRRVPLSAKPRHYAAVWQDNSTYKLYHPETGVEVSTIDFENPYSQQRHPSSQWLAVRGECVAGVVGFHVWDLQTGVKLGCFPHPLSGGTSTYLTRAIGLVAGDNLGINGQHQKLRVFEWVLNDSLVITDVRFNWWQMFWPDIGSGLRFVDMDEFFVYAVNSLRNLWLLTRTSDQYEGNQPIKIYNINRSMIATGPKDSAPDGDVAALVVCGSLIYVYWSNSGSGEGDFGEIRVYDLAGRPAQALSAQSRYLPGVGEYLARGTTLGGDHPPAFNQFPLVDVITGVRSFTGGGDVGMKVIGRMVIVDNQNTAGTLVRAINIDDKAIKWTVTSSVTAGGQIMEVQYGAQHAPTTGDENPAWIAYDVLTNTRYGCGFPVSMVDEASFREASIYFAQNKLFLSPIFRERGSALQHLESMLLLVDTFLTFSGGKFKLKPRRQEPASNIPAITTEAYTKGQGVVVSREGNTDLISRVIVHYTNRTQDYTPDTQEARLLGQAHGRELEIGGEAIADPELARKLAYRTLWVKSVKRLTGVIPIGPQDGHIEPADVIAWTDADLGLSSKRMRIVGLGEESDGRTMLEALEENEYIMEWDAPLPGDVIVPVNPQPQDPAAHTRLSVLELGPVPVNGNPSIVAIISGIDKAWAGARLYASDDNVTYTRIAEIGVGSVWGVTKTALAATPSQFLDETNTVDVEILAPDVTLMSVTDSQFRAGVNRILIGSEVIYFRTATLVSGQRYALSTLLRGMELTTAASHNVEAGALILNQYAVVLTPVRGTVPRVGLQPIQSMPIDWLLVGRTMFFKATSRNVMGEEQPISEVPPVSLSYKATGGMPTKINNLQGVNMGAIQTSGVDFEMGAATSLSVSASPNRHLKTVWAYTDVSIQEDSELEQGVVDDKDPNFRAYRITYRVASVVKRIREVTSETDTYTESENIADNGLWQSAVEVIVQIVGKDGGLSEAVSRAFTMTVRT
jgi:hypothetical protein